MTLLHSIPDIAAEWSDRNLPLLPTMVTALQTVRLGGNAKIAETSGTLLFQRVPVGADVRIAADIHCSKDLMTWRLRTLTLRLSGQKEIIP